MANLQLPKHLISPCLFSILFLFPVWGFSQKKNGFIPDAVMVQHAGSIGYLSIGAGYHVFGDKRETVDLFFGYVPKTKGGKLAVLAAKFAYRPFAIKVKDAAVIHPFNPGFFFSYTMGKNLTFDFDEEQYPRNYYGWSESFRMHLSFSNEIELSGKMLFGDEKIKAVVLYSEFNANDRYLASWALNAKGLSVAEIFKLGVGVRLRF